MNLSFPENMSPLTSASAEEGTASTTPPNTTAADYDLLPISMPELGYVVAGTLAAGLILRKFIFGKF